MLNQNTSNPQPQIQKRPDQQFLTQSKEMYLRLNVDFKQQADLSMGISIIAALQKQMKQIFDHIDKQSAVISQGQRKETNEKIMERCMACSQRNNQLLMKILRVKQQLIVRMYLGKCPSKINQMILNNSLAEIRKSKMKIRDHLKELQIKRISMKSLSNRFSGSQLHIEDQEYNILRNGLQILGKESFELWNEISAISKEKREKNI